MKEVGRKQGASPPCAACKLLRRRCCPDCVFRPYFPADEPLKFATVHKVFGASNVSKMLQELPEQQRVDAVTSMVYEASARMRDPVYGCVAAISYLQQQVDGLAKQLALAQAEVVHLRAHQATPSQSTSPSNNDYPSSYTFPNPEPSFDFDLFDFDLDMVVEQATSFRESMWSFPSYYDV